MLCTFAKGVHLGTCRDRFIFGSCCRLPDTSSVVENPGGGPSFEATIVENEDQEWEDRVNGLEIDDVCGRRWADTGDVRIQGGEVANRTSWPWQVGLRLKHGDSGDFSSHHCGAVLLNHHWVATAAHCVYK